MTMRVRIEMLAKYAWASTLDECLTWYNLPLGFQVSKFQT